jgi:hypothetical protein
VRCGARRRSILSRVELPSPHNCRGEWKRMACGSSPSGTSVQPHELNGIAGRDAKLISNSSAASLARALRAAGSFGGLSLTTNLVRVSMRSQSGTCEAYLGVGHLHRGEGELNRKMYRRRPHGPPPWELGGRRAPDAPRRRQPFAFGFRYTHFLYALAPHPPFTTLAVSAEFCLAAHARHDDCESIQFISGLAIREDAVNDAAAIGGVNSTLLLTYGVNDCEARIGTLALADAWAMLRPVPLSEAEHPSEFANPRRVAGRACPWAPPT